MAANSAAGVPHDGAPPARNESKRERKRQLLQDRIQQLSENFSRGRDSAYREQLQKIQLDTTLIMRVDPYVDRPLDALADDESDIPLQNTDPETAKTLLSMAGPRFRDWKQDIEDLMEERDYEINKQKVGYTFTSPVAKDIADLSNLKERIRCQVRGTPQCLQLQNPASEAGALILVFDRTRSTYQHNHSQEISLE